MPPRETHTYARSLEKKQGARSKGRRLAAGDLTYDVDYRHWIGELKARYRAAQIKASIAVNSALIEFYWGLGKDISEKYPGKKRNAHFFENLSNDLLVGIENPKGLSPTNIKYALYFYQLYRPQVADDKGNGYRPQLADDLVHIPWGHHRYIIDKCHADVDKALFYVRRTVEHNWSRTDLQIQHDAGLFEKTGKATNNFGVTLAAPDGHLAKEMVKSEYSFELLESVDEHDERAVERALVKNITRTLTELGGGFAYVGHQVRVTVGGTDFWPDLIFYHLKYRRYLVIELKAGDFKPEHIGQLGFYMVAVDRQVKHEWDGPTVGLVLCRDGDRTVAEYALSISDMPMGVGKYKLSKTAPADMPEIALPVARLEAVVDETLAAHALANTLESAIRKAKRTKSALKGGKIMKDILTRQNEGLRFEAKLAAGGLPKSLWETYCSFANTDGGIAEMAEPARVKVELELLVDEPANGAKAGQKVGQNEKPEGQKVGQNDRFLQSDLTASAQLVLASIREDASFTSRGLAAKLGFAETTIDKALSTLTARGLIRHVGSRKGGHWEVLA